MADRSPKDRSDLPIVDEIGEQLQRAAGGWRPDGTRPRERPGTGRRRSRWLYPALAVGVLVIALLPAIPALLLPGDEQADPRREAATAARGAPVLATGTGPEEAWEVVSLGERCVALQAGGEMLATTGCDSAAASSPGGATEDRSVQAAQPVLTEVRAVNGGRDGYVTGWVGEEVEQVRVRVGARPPETVPARAIASDGQVRHLFVAAFDEPVAQDAPVRVTALDADGRPLADSRAVTRP